MKYVVENMESSEYETAKPNWLAQNWVWLAALAVVISWLANLGLGWFQLWQALVPGQRTTFIDAGVFGDMFGAVNALFSGLSIVGIVYAIQQQDQQLKLAREEAAIARATLKIAIEDADKTKAILSEQQSQLRLQNEATTRQMFESTFFNLMEMFFRVRDSIDIDMRNGSKKIGADAFKFLLGRFHQFFDENDYAQKKSVILEERHNLLKKSYDEFYDDCSGDMGHYFRTLYNVLKFIDKSIVENDRMYAEILRAHISDQECALLFYNLFFV